MTKENTNIEDQLMNQNKEQQVQLDGGTYEIIRKRLLSQKDDLAKRLKLLNQSRKEVFGSVETKLVSNDRISTANNCIAADIVSFGKFCIFGYNVHIGLRSGISIKDTFSFFEFRDQGFHEMENSLLVDKNFEADFENLFKYYRNTVFKRFVKSQNYLYLVFQLSKNPKDVKVFKWLLKGAQLEYVDDRSDAEVNPPAQHEFRWKKATRDMHRDGAHPHVSIMDRVFVETVGGDLTIKVEDNTDSGRGIYEEKVDFKEQTLDDAEFYYADLGNLIALRIKPYKEENRFIVFNEKVQSARRIDALKESGVFLPDNQGLMFSNGYYLQTGTFKEFDFEEGKLQFERKIASPNGEDWAFIFYNTEQGVYVILPYNLIEQSVKTPIICNGYTIFEDGEMCYFKRENEASKNHLVQIWQTPFSKAEMISEMHQDNYLFKIGNKDIVKAMADCNEVITLLSKEDSYEGLYIDLVKKSNNILDAYYWINKEGSFLLSEPVGEIRKASNSAIDEFEKVVKIRRSTGESINEVQTKVEDLMTKVKRERFEKVDTFVAFLSEIRKLRGEVISLKELRYTNVALSEKMDEQLAEQNELLSQNCVDFLLKDNALKPYEEKVDLVGNKIEKVSKETEGKSLLEEIETVGSELQLMIEIVGNLKIEDATQTTKIIDNVSTLYAHLNQSRALLKNKQKDLKGREAKAEFGAQLKLLEQGLVNFLDLCKTPENCDEYLSRLMIQLEELEGKFSDFDEFSEIISQRREEIYTAFENRKLNLNEQRNKRAMALDSSAERILKSISNRLEKLESANEINSYFASDLMVDKVRDIVRNLISQEDNVRAESIQSKLKTVKQDALRQLKDRKELFVDGENIIRFGTHNFLVNKQALELSIVERDGELFYHLNGTQFYQSFDNAEINKTKAVWGQLFPSENASVYRAEFLAYQLFKQDQKAPVEVARVKESLLALMDKNYEGSFVKGVHESDAEKIFMELQRVSSRIGLIGYPVKERVFARLFWESLSKQEEPDNTANTNQEKKALYKKQIAAAAQMKDMFPDSESFNYLIESLEEDLEVYFAAFCEMSGVEFEMDSKLAAQYLFDQLLQSDKFQHSKDSYQIVQAFHAYLKEHKSNKKLELSLQKLDGLSEQQFLLAEQWLNAFVAQASDKLDKRFIQEAALMLVYKDFGKGNVIDCESHAQLENMLGDHLLVEGGKYSFDFHDFTARLRNFENEVLPMYRKYSSLKKELSQEFRSNIRLNEYKPKVMSSFVRNKLINDLYLPLIGNNLSKQIGTAGENKRTDLQGLLLLISPPGYGKTTLMEYIAHRLGLIFVKVNGPAIGHKQTSLDPEEATNAATRSELEKLNFALEMGDNIMLYLDDIQHCNPEFLQKFISLCDAQRKIEGMYNGVAKTYDLRGRKVAVVMAGNPYTESGDKFQIPDMLANRSDIYNLGDIIGDSESIFKLSFVENAMTSNPILSRLHGKSRQDVMSLIQWVETDSQEGLSFEANHTPEELEEYFQLIKKMLIVRDVLNKVNQAYIHSAAQDNAYRVEPTFKLQGSYRDMNKLTARLVPLMNEEELRQLILSHYESESQTLTSNAEANLLKFKVMMEYADDAELKRWSEIVATFQKNHQTGDENQIAQVIREMNKFANTLLGDIDRRLEE